MIFYFSGTGNSEFLAKCIAEQIEDRLISINQMLKEGCWDDYHSEDLPFVFVAPTYGWRVPRIVESFIRQTKFSGTKDVYFLLTCGSETGNAVKYVRELCAEKGFRLKGFADFVLPENYTAMFPCTEPGEANKLVREAYLKLLPLIPNIRERENFPAHQAKLKALSLINPIFYTFFVKARKFRVSEDCIHCGKCVEVCPLGNISMRGKEEQIVFADRCTHCMACINNCPTEAIDYGLRTKGKHRYLFSRDIDVEAVKRDQ